jgi:hypothetical protein
VAPLPAAPMGENVVSPPWPGGAPNHNRAWGPAAVSALTRWDPPWHAGTGREFRAVEGGRCREGVDAWGRDDNRRWEGVQVGAVAASDVRDFVREREEGPRRAWGSRVGIGRSGETRWGVKINNSLTSEVRV